MTAFSYSRGWLIKYIDGSWVYDDTEKSLNNKRECRRCGIVPTLDGHDACLGDVSGLSSACCGHGVEQAFVMYK